MTCARNASSRKLSKKGRQNQGVSGEQRSEFKELAAKLASMAVESLLQADAQPDEEFPLGVLQ